MAVIGGNRPEAYDDLLLQADALAQSGDYDRSVASLARAFDNARARGDLDDILFSGKFLAQQRLNRMELDAARRVATEAAAAAHQLGDDVAAELCEMVAVKAGLMAPATFPEAAARLGDIRSGLTDDHELLYRIDVIAAWLNVIGMQGRPKDALAESEALVAVCEPHRDESDLLAHGYATACFHTAQFLYMLNQPDRVLHFIGEANRYYTRLGRLDDVATCVAVEANARSQLGDLVDFDPLPAVDRPVGPRASDPAVRSLELATAAHIAYERGEFERSLELWTAADDMGHVPASPTAWAGAALGRAHALAAIGRWDPAREALEQATQRFEAFDGTDGIARCLACSANVHLGRGAADDARQAFQASADLFEQAGLVPDAAVARSGAAIAGAEAGLPAADMLAELDRCIAVLSDSGRRAHAADLIRHQGRIRWRNADPAGAAESARAARRILESSGLTTAVVRCDVLEAAATMSFDPVSAEPRMWDALARLRPLVSSFELAVHHSEVASVLMDTGRPASRVVALELLTEVIVELDRLRYTLRRERDRAAWAASWRRAVDAAVTLAVEQGAPDRVARIIEMARVQPVPASTLDTTSISLTTDLGNAAPGSVPALDHDAMTAYRSESPTMTAAEQAATFAFAGTTSFALSPPVEVVVEHGTPGATDAGAIRIDLDDVRRSVDPGAVWWGTWLTEDALVWYLVDPDGSVHAGSSPRRDDLLDGLRRAVARPHESDGSDDPAPGVLTERMITGPLGTGRPLAGRFGLDSPRRPAGLDVDWPGHTAADHGAFMADLGAWLIPPRLAQRLAAALEAGRVESVLVATGPELGGIPWGLVAIPGVDGIPIGGSSDPRRVMEAAEVGVVPSVGFLASLEPARGGTSSVIVVCDPLGDLYNARHAPPGATRLFGTVDVVDAEQPAPVPATVAAVTAALSGVERGCPGLFVYQGHAVVGDTIDAAGLRLADGVLTPRAFFGADGGGRLNCPAAAALFACDSLAAHVGVEWSGITPALLWGGARYVLSTSWPTLDVVATSEFEADLADHIAEGLDVPGVLRRLQLSRLADWRARPSELTMPYLWGGYQVTRGIGADPAG